MAAVVHCEIHGQSPDNIEFTDVCTLKKQNIAPVIIILNMPISTNCPRSGCLKKDIVSIWGKYACKILVIVRRTFGQYTQTPQSQLLKFNYPTRQSWA